VREGLRELDNCQWVIIHDAARPFLTNELIDSGLSAAHETGAAIAAVPVTDTIKKSDDRGIVIETLNRRQLWAVQTPQVFRSDIITKAYESMTDDVTDDASLVEGLGINVKVFMGSYKNIKITTPMDMAVADILARET
jgi:2-C-methyl-D-erythritol 4-phosphate cytidylyltransferase